MNFNDLAGQIRRDGDELVQKHISRVQAEAEKRQAIYDEVLEDGQGKSLEEVRSLLAQRWREAFGEDIAELDLSEKANALAAGERINVQFKVKR